MQKIKEDLVDDLKVAKPGQTSKPTTKASIKWDVENKGFLNEEERRAKELDKEGKGYLSQDESLALSSSISDLLADTAHLKRSVVKLHRLIFCLLIVIMGLGGGLIGAIIKNSNENREATVKNSNENREATVGAVKNTQVFDVAKDGILMAINGVTEITVASHGVTVIADIMKITNSDGSVRDIYCIRKSTAAKMWLDNEAGKVVRLSLPDSGESSMKSILLSSGDASIVGETLYFGENTLVNDDRCDPQERKLSLVNVPMIEHINHARRGLRVLKTGGWVSLSNDKWGSILDMTAGVSKRTLSKNLEDIKDWASKHISLNQIEIEVKFAMERVTTKIRNRFTLLKVFEKLSINSEEPLLDCCEWQEVRCDEVGEVIRLRLNQRDLTGSIPTELGNLSNLQELHLDDNELIGSIPTELGNLSNLQKLYLDNNELIGSIPTELGNLVMLQNIHLHDNQLTGLVPSELYRFESYFFRNNNNLDTEGMD